MKISLLNKKILYILPFVLSACASDINEEISINQSLKKIVVSAKNWDTSVETRTSMNTTTKEFIWSKNDTIGIFPSTGYQAAFPMANSDGVGASSAEFNGGGWALVPAHTYYGYYPFEYNNRSLEAIQMNYLGQKQTGNDNLDHIGSWDYMYAYGETPTDGSVQFTFSHLSAMWKLALTIPEATDITEVQLISNSNKFVTKGTFNLAQATATTTPSITPKEGTQSSILSIDLEGVATTEANQTITVYVMTAPVAFPGETLTIKALSTNKWYKGSKTYQTGNFSAGKVNNVPLTLSESGELWNGEVSEEDAVEEENNTYTITTPAQLAWFAEQVNSGNTFEGKTVQLGADIDLNNQEWTPIGYVGTYFKGTFDGKNYTVSNFKITASANTTNAGLFGYVVSATLKNFTIDNAQILYPENYTGDFYGSAVLGCGYCMTLEGITVENSIIQGNNKVGGLMARHCENAKLSVTNCHVKNSTIETKNEADGGNVGGLIGYIDLGSAETNVITNSSVTGCNINAVNSSNSGKRGNSQFVGGVNSTKAAKLTITDCTVSNNTYNEKETTYVSPFDGVFVGGERNDNKQCTVVINGTEYPVKPVTMNGEKYFTIAEALNAISGTDAVEITLGEGTFEWPNQEINNTLTVKGTSKEKSIVVVNGISNPNIINFEDLTMTRTPETKYATVQFNHAVQENYTNCIINGCVRLLVTESATFKNCTFYNTEKSGFNGYSIHYYGYSGSTLNVTDCTFETVSKAICAFNEGKMELNMNITNSQFKASDKDDKAAIQMHTEKGIYGTLNVTNCTATGFADINNGLWNELNNTTTVVSDNFLKTIDGKVYVQTQAGLQAAINAGKEEITIVKSVTATERISIPSGKKITIKGASKDVKYTGSVKVVGELHLSDLTLSIDQAMADNLENDDEVSQYSKSIIALVNEGDVYCDNVTFDYSLADATAITAWWSTGTGANISVKNCTFNCNGQRPIRSDACVTAENCTFNDPYRYAVQMTSKSSTMNTNALAYVNFKNNTINAGTTSEKTVVYGVQLEGEEYGCNDLTINGEGNKIVLGTTGKTSAMYYCECGDKMDHATIVWNTEVAPVHGGATEVQDGVQQSGDLYLLSNANGMKWFADQVNNQSNSFSGKTVQLTADIDLNNMDWEPIGQTKTGATTFNGVFDGQNFTISNLSVDSENETGDNYSSGLFGWVETHTDGCGILKNVKINTAKVVGHHNCGALVGYITEKYAKVINCHVTAAEISCTTSNTGTDNYPHGDKAGALIGNATVATTVTKCTATNSTVSAGCDAGQLIGAAKSDNVTECSATNVTVTSNNTCDDEDIREQVIGREL